MGKKRYIFDVEASSLDGNNEPILVETKDIPWTERFQKSKNRGWIIWPPTIIIIFSTIYLYLTLLRGFPGLELVIWLMIGCCIWLIIGTIFLSVLDVRHNNKKWRNKIGA